MGTKTKKNVKIDRTAADEPVAQRRIKVLRTLKNMAATSVPTARPGSLLSSKLGYTAYDVYCLLYPKYFLGVNGYVQQIKEEGDREVHYFITAKGLKFLASGGEAKASRSAEKTPKSKGKSKAKARKPRVHVEPESAPDLAAAV